MRFTAILAVCVAAVTAAPTTAQADAALIAANVQNIEQLFAAVPTLDTVLASKYPQLSKDGKVDTKIMANLPGDLIGAGVDLVLSIPGTLHDVAGNLLEVPGNILGFVGDILHGGSYGGSYGGGYGGGYGYDY